MKRRRGYRPRSWIDNIASTGNKSCPRYGTVVRGGLRSGNPHVHSRYSKHFIGINGQRTGKIYQVGPGCSDRPAYLEFADILIR